MTQADKSLRRGVAYLHRTQNPDGGFEGLASPDARNFQSPQVRHHPTIFMTALVLTALRTVPGTASVRRAAADFLLRHKSAGWSWNYWVRDRRAARLRRYPDDLDDTMCALAALTTYDATLIDGTVLAEVARQLIATEQAPGGPYRTWLVEEPTTAWRDVDIVVNANIGYCLWLQQVQLLGLERYLVAAIGRSQLASPYYVGIVPTLYFLARWYQGAQAGRLRMLTARELADSIHTDNALMLALLVTAAVSLQVSAELRSRATRRLLELQAPDGSWPASALYFEPPVNRTRYYAGSPALTTALCLEALTTAHQCQSGEPPSATVASTEAMLAVAHSLALQHALKLAQSIGDPDVRRLYRQQLRRLAARDRDHQITAMATVTALACGQPLDDTTLLQLNSASLQGWLAYTIYDDVWDSAEDGVALFGVANLALRRCLASFAAAALGPAFQDMVAEALDLVDSANTWEIRQARTSVVAGRLQLSHLPDYGDYRQLAQRSWGHTLASRGVLLATGQAAAGRPMQALERFFRHFLIARQLSDDAHDWEDDLRHGHISAVGRILLASWPGQPAAGAIELHFSADLEGLRQHFWNRTLVELGAILRHHVAAARVALADCGAVADRTIFEGWLDGLEAGLQQALEGRRKVSQFMARYAG